MVGLLLQESSWLVKAVAFDGHQAHVMFRQALFGELPASEMSDMPFWQDLIFEELPKHSMPRLPAKLCRYHGEVLWPLCGPCAPYCLSIAFSACS